MRVLLVVLAIVVVLLTISASARAEIQNVSVVWFPGAPPPCIVGGNPDEKACINSSQDNVAPSALPWLTAVRENPAINWTLTYGSWQLNATGFFVWGNVKSTIMLPDDIAVLGTIFQTAERAGSSVTLRMSSDTALIVVQVEGISEPNNVTWHGLPIAFSYDPNIAGGTLTVTPTFTQGDLVIRFPVPRGGGGTARPLPLLSGLTNFPQFNVLPDIEQISTLSCNNVTLRDPRSGTQVSATSSWVFNFGDGSMPVRTGQPQATHLYGEPGTYNVTMTVVDHDGAGTAYAGRVDTTPAACGFQIFRSIAFTVLVISFGALIAASVFLPRRTRQEKRRWRRIAVGCLAGAVILVVIL